MKWCPASGHTRLLLVLTVTLGYRNCHLREKRIRVRRCEVACANSEKWRITPKFKANPLPQFSSSCCFSASGHRAVVRLHLNLCWGNSPESLLIYWAYNIWGCSWVTQSSLNPSIKNLIIDDETSGASLTVMLASVNSYWTWTMAFILGSKSDFWQDFPLAPKNIPYWIHGILKNLISALRDQ